MGVRRLPVSDPRAEAAAWVVRLSADDPQERVAAQLGFDQWRSAHPDHERAAVEVEVFLGRTREIAGAGTATEAAGVAARQVLGRMVGDARKAGSRRTARMRRSISLLAIGCALLLPALGWYQGMAPADLLADLHTTAGERRSQQLADGSGVLLSSRTALNFHATGGQRRLELLHGEVLIDVAKDPTRPFVVETDQGRIRALGTRFIVRQEGESTLLTMLESRTAVTAGLPRGAPADAEPTIVSAGQVARLNGGHVVRLPDIPAAMTEEAYRQHRLVVSDRPLSHVLDELARHRRGLIRYDRQAIEGIRVSAVLRLDDIDQSLQLLASSFPQLRFRTLGPFLVTVEKAG